MLARTRLDILHIKLSEMRYAPLFTDPLRTVRAGLYATVWACYAHLFAVQSAFAGEVPSQAWLGTWGLPLFLADTLRLGTPFLENAAAYPYIVLYAYSPVVLFFCAFFCTYSVAVLAALAKQVVSEIRLYIAILETLVRETFSPDTRVA